jgi:hypothetical protein
MAACSVQRMRPARALWCNESSCRSTCLRLLLRDFPFVVFTLFAYPTRNFLHSLIRHVWCYFLNLNCS